jgi:hypothetical protein
VGKTRAESIADRFWAKVLKTDTCWLWQGHVLRDGYGQFGKIGERRAHRRAWFLTHGPIPDGLQVCHRCDTPLCVRPDHLFLGTAQDNIADRDTKGRQAKGARNFFYNRHGYGAKPGEQHHSAKLTDVQVTDIRRRYAEGNISQYALAAEYRVTQGHISNLIRGKMRS